MTDLIAKMICDAPACVERIEKTTYFLINIRKETFRLKFLERRGDIYVLEAPGFAKLPARCPERHINRDGTFCIGKDAGKLICSSGNRIQWWETLQKFLSAQITAAKFGYWRADGLSHGEAADLQLQVEHLADELGLLHEYTTQLQEQGEWKYLVMRLHDEKYAQMATLEKLRREKESEVIVSLYDSGVRCCETMHRCMLRNFEATKNGMLYCPPSPQ